MQIEPKVVGDAMIVTVKEKRIDAASAIQFKEAVRELASDGPARVVLDMTQVEFLDSSGLGAMVATMKNLGPERTLELCGLSGTVGKVFRLTRMDTVFAIHETAEAAIENLKNAS